MYGHKKWMGKPQKSHPTSPSTGKFPLENTKAKPKAMYVFKSVSGVTKL